MDIEGFKKELNVRMNSFIEGEHLKSPEGDVTARAATLGKFRMELKSVVNRLVDEHKLIFTNDAELHNFMNHLNEPIQSLMGKYISG